MNDSEEPTPAGRGEHEHVAPHETKPPPLDEVHGHTRDYEEGRVPAPTLQARFPLTLKWRHVSWRQAVRDSFSVITGLMVVVLFFVWIVFGAQTIEKQNQAIARDEARIVAIHGQAAADRSCASTKLLAFIIFTGNRRAHVLHTGAYLKQRDKEEIRGYVKAACLYEPPTLSMPGGDT